MKRMRGYCRPFLAAIAALCVLSMTACSAGPDSIHVDNTAAGAADYSVTMQQNKSITARFYGLMTFKFAGTEVISTAEFAVPPIPIYWMSGIFNGQLDEGEPGGDITNTVHGSLSDDGAWITTMFFSRQVLSSGTMYRVTLRNVPLISRSQGTAGDFGKFEQSGPDIRKYVEKIEYYNGPVNGKQITSTTEYISTDWNSSIKGMAPALRIAFSEEVPTGANSSNNGMGMRR